MVYVNSQSFKAEYLKTPEEIENGMMWRDNLEGCMVFKLGKGHHSFWMKNCVIPLDIVFILNGRISHIHPNCPPAEKHIMNPPKYSGIGDHVIEFPAGTATNWKPGDKVSMYLGSPQNPVNATLTR
jgi:uncharacterized membrane protein (UPF0127 family)